MWLYRFLGSKVLNVILIVIIIIIGFSYLSTCKDIENKKPIIIFPPKTEIKKLSNGDSISIKPHNSSTLTPMESGFTKEFLRDTIDKLLRIKSKDLKQLNVMNGIYKDSLKFYKEEMNDKNEKVKIFNSRDKKGNVNSTVKIFQDSTMVYKGNVSIITAIKKGKDIDTIIFYDPSQHITINNSREFTYITKPKEVKKKFTFSVQVGTGLVFPEFDRTKVNWGGYVGVGISYNF